MRQRKTFRPQIQTLETRRCMTGILGTEGTADSNFLLADGSVRFLTDDVVAEVHSSAGPGGGPHVRVFDGSRDASSDTGQADSIQYDAASSLTAQEVDAVFAYASRFIGGVRVATGDINGDGADEIITSAQVF